jgi:hypothetical protein
MVGRTRDDQPGSRLLFMEAALIFDFSLLHAA